MSRRCEDLMDGCTGVHRDEEDHCLFGSIGPLRLYRKDLMDGCADGRLPASRERETDERERERLGGRLPGASQRAAAVHRARRRA